MKLPRIIRKKTKFISADLECFDRRLVIIGSEKKIQEISKRSINWKKLGRSIIPVVGLIELINELSQKEITWEWYPTNEMPPALNIVQARKKFKFPMNHPVDGVMYSCCDSEPELYLPVAGFHEYMYQARMNAFVELCSQLGAKEISVLYAEEDGKDITAKVKGNGIPTSNGNLDGEVASEFTKSSARNINVFYSFDPPSKPLAAYSKAWINAEPTWSTLQKLRIDGNIKRSKAELNHTDEMNITADIAASLSKLGLNIGGNYSEFVKRKFTFQVDFWAKEDAK